MTGTKVVGVLCKCFPDLAAGEGEEGGLMAKYRKPKVCPVSPLFIPEDECLCHCQALTR